MENSSKKKRIKLTSDVKQIILIVAAFTIMILVFSIGSEYFLKKDNIITILISAVPLGLIAIGECACLVTGVFDMSPGMVASLAGVIWATLITQFGMNTWLAFAIALFFGLFSGAIAGVSTAWFMMPAWMSTYALMQIWRGVIMIITGGKAINMSAYPEFKVLGQTKITNSITLPILLLIIIYVIVYFVFKYTKFGRSLFIVGGNIEAAKNAGLPVKSIQFFCFVLSGGMAALGGLVFASRSASANPIIGELYAMQAISATVVGGTKMGGGKANIAMTFIGVLIMVGMQNGLNMIRLPAFYQYIASGLILFIAVMLQTSRQN